jgi:hypothetical protein
MPVSEEILGFSNRWYGPALLHSVTREVAPELTIRLVIRFGGNFAADYNSQLLKDHSNRSLRSMTAAGAVKKNSYIEARYIKTK